MSEYQGLIAEHQALQKQLADQPVALDTERVRRLIERAGDAGEHISAHQQREQMRAILKYWGAFVYECTGEYPRTQLAPYKPRHGRERKIPKVLIITTLFVVLAAAVAMWRPWEIKSATSTPRPSTLCNGDFEDNFECWQFGGELDQSVECDNHGCYAILGNPDYVCLGGVPVGEAWIKQDFKVPQEISSTLSLRYRVFSNDLDLPGFDYFQVAINGQPLPERYGNYEWNEASCDQAPWDSGWRTLTIDLSIHAGNEIEISFHNVNGTQPFFNTWTYLDEVNIGTYVDDVSIESSSDSSEIGTLRKQ